MDGCGHILGSYWSATDNNSFGRMIDFCLEASSGSEDHGWSRRTSTICSSIPITAMPGTNLRVALSTPGRDYCKIAEFKVHWSLTLITGQQSQARNPIDYRTPPLRNPSTKWAFEDDIGERFATVEQGHHGWETLHDTLPRHRITLAK